MTGVAGVFAYQGAALSRLQGDWRITITDPQLDWTTESIQLAARAEDLVRNDPVMAALMESKISGTHGNAGLRFRSLYAEDGSNETSPAETEMRRVIDDLIAQASNGRQLDATGLMCRSEFEEAIDRLATSKGECFAIRKYIPDRPASTIATCWQIIQPYRVTNPPGRPNDATLYEGIELDANGAPAGIHIAPAMRGTAINARLFDAKDWDYVPWYAPDGSCNIIHRIGLRPPGGYRGITAFAPLMAIAKQVKGTIEAYVVAKRIQACHPIFIKADDPVAAAKADRNGAVWGNNTTIEPGKTYYIGRDADMVIPQWSFNGADMNDFLNALYRNQFAAWGMPICVVLGQMSSGSNQAARSDWMQYYRTCQRWQDDHIEQCSRIIDESILRESVARGRLQDTGQSWARYMQGRYVRPPKSMPEPTKEVQGIKGWADLGRDMTSAFAEAGLDFRESVMQRAEDNALLKAQGVELVTDNVGKTGPGQNEDGADEPKGDEPPKPSDEKPADDKPGTP